MKKPKLELYLENKCLGIITLSEEETDFPWFVGNIVFTENYKQYKDLFVEYEKHFNSINKDEVNDCMEIWGEIQAKDIRIKSLAKNTFDIPSTVNIEGSRIAWRLKHCPTD